MVCLVVVIVAAATDGSGRPYGTISWDWVTTYQEWINNGCNDPNGCPIDQFRYDLAVVRLSSAPNVGWLGLAASDVFNQIPVTTAG